jgi:hypothetical protein
MKIKDNPLPFVLSKRAREMPAGNQIIVRLPGGRLAQKTPKYPLAI